LRFALLAIVIWPGVVAGQDRRRYAGATLMLSVQGSVKPEGEGPS
jgi:hypothetical protein